MDRLDNTIRPYAWGSVTAIPRLLGTEPTGEPQAEMWMGAHPGAPSRTARGTLADVIDADPRGTLGTPAVERFGPRLPFLLKILAAGAPVSLQVHPDLPQAQRGHAREDRLRIPLDAPHRTYKDANHKPELICALTPFEGLCGFREPTATADLLTRLGVDSLKPYADMLRAHPPEAALREALTAFLTADRAEIAATVAEAAQACDRLARYEDPATGNPTGSATGGTSGTPAPGPASAYAAYASLAHHYPGDPGVLAAMLLHHVRLQPGEALFLGAGVPHTYLQGLGVEIMANSDNVLRCGLTPKHIDVPELLRVVRFEAADPGILRPEASPDGEEVYDTPIDEFRLSRLVHPEGAVPATLTADTPQIVMCTAGTVTLHGEGPDETLAPGASVFVPAGEKTRLTGAGTVFRATVVI
ncbi:mannose-6-phosphate isomerase, class I [Streptomyces uncialis]|uniref:mannose-6-phosphate isomerase, class I n=1 Tax=Streptomyces uncialis TaxID=1048205 RepID=UPI00224D555D|nr:mannose-6-phosphate isomerase, class I [Streptomyces uncialis]MCX4664210.1 mannose-6-phosphate isomerase, class I [Streptomyces uncialis]